ncbi:type II toxin-antitoxin system RelE/ParE family toxin [Nitrosomonas sp. Nm33]|uniref:type II toxin-antitoxin system RelE/ParE family toxin n=1 Tax=Nitrosomonas sp. Nm33 TaxID=133724 RepID=UPI0015A40EE6
MYKLDIGPEAQNDLKALLQESNKSRQCATRILTVLQELEENQKLLGYLLDHGFKNKDFNVSRVVSIWRYRDVWRLKIFGWDFSSNKENTLPYRVIYAYDWKSLTFIILAVVHRSFNYDANHPITQRIIKAYDELGMQVLTTCHRPYKH